ncbi:MAG TPA: M1 family aminopeptidase [Candidatus Acidoferrales bacterium]|nr:M1 family aminopeptidase [Candidatus Acidoferrales bacterium]
MIDRADHVVAVIFVLSVVRGNETIGKPQPNEPLGSFRRRFAGAAMLALLCLAAAIGGGIFTRQTAHAAAPPQGQMKSHIFGNPDVWHWAPSRTYHVENYKLAFHFDEPKGKVFGDEVITLRPFDQHFHKFYLNSAGLRIESVTLEPAQGAAVRLAYDADGKDSRLWITLNREYNPADSLRVRIVYHGLPRTGLFFVNPTRDYPNLPREVYSQGEPEFNQYWFPCWDYPNDMATSETITTVPEGQVVVSNGKLVKVTRAAGQVTYDWVESIPHSSYLTSLAIGPWHKISDKYENKPVDYYVPPYIDDATTRRSLHLTPDMIAFFSRATGVDYPYEQYAQTMVHNYVFGGQENVSATTLTDFLLHDARAEQDYPSTDVVSHELGQHWFGDYVQGYDWPDIWLNEGFATYMEALYTQHHEDYDAYRFAIYNDQMTEQTEGRENYSRPIVDRHYNDPLDMFDATTHEKGAAILDMLRYLIDGPEAASHEPSQNELFFRALHHYLVAHHEQVADTAGLISAFRDTTGQELGWFFHEWVYMAGHPAYRVQATYDAAEKMEKISVAQTQHVDAETPVFDMPIELAFYGANGEHKQIQVRDNLQQQEFFDVSLDFTPQWVDFDPDDFIDKIVDFEKPAAMLAAEVQKDPSMMSRLWAAQQLGNEKSADADAAVAALAWTLANDKFYAVRAAAASSLGNLRTDQAKAALLAALRQPDSRVRTAVVEALGNFSQDKTVYDAFVNELHSDDSYAAEAAAAEAIGASGNAQAFEVLQAESASHLEVHVMQATLAGLAETKDPRALSILLAQSRAGVEERVRMTALALLPTFKDAMKREHAQELVNLVRTALDDPYVPVRMGGERLAASFDLTQFRTDIQADVDAPLVFRRELARKVLEELKTSKQ